MNCVDARPVRNIDDRFDLQVTFSGSGGSCTVSFVRQPNVQRAGISLGIDRDGRDVQIAAGADDAHHDLSAISNQNFSKHQTWSVVSCYLSVVQFVHGSTVNNKLLTTDN